MSAQSVALKWFALDAKEARTEQPLNILGAGMLAKLSDDDSDGTVAIFHRQQTILRAGASAFAPRGTAHMNQYGLGTWGRRCREASPLGKCL